MGRQHKQHWGFMWHVHNGIINAYAGRKEIDAITLAAIDTVLGIDFLR